MVFWEVWMLIRKIQRGLDGKGFWDGLLGGLGVKKIQTIEWQRLLGWSSGRFGC